MAKAEFLYNGAKIVIQCDDNDKLESIFQKFSIKTQKKVDELCFLYGGQFIDKNSTFIKLSNSIDKERKTMSIIVTDDEQKDNNSDLLKENKELKEKLNEANKIIEEQKKEIQELKYEITKIKSEGMTQVNSLMELIDKKDKENKQLKENQNKNNINTNNTTPKITLQFKSFDDEMKFSIKCLGTEPFLDIEEQLYEAYPKYKNYNTCFTFEGSLIDKFKTINENGIKRGGVIFMTYR